MVYGASGLAGVPRAARARGARAGAARRGGARARPPARGAGRPARASRSGGAPSRSARARAGAPRDRARRARVRSWRRAGLTSRRGWPISSTPAPSSTGTATATGRSMGAEDGRQIDGRQGRGGSTRRRRAIPETQRTLRDEPEGEATQIGPPPDREESRDRAHDPARRPRARRRLRRGAGSHGRELRLGRLRRRGPRDRRAGRADRERAAVAAAPAAAAGAPPTRSAPAAAALPAGSDPLTTETAELGARGGRRSVARARRAAGQTSSVIADAAGGVRLALVVGEALARGLGEREPLDVRVLLHRVATYPVIALLRRAAGGVPGAPAGAAGDRGARHRRRPRPRGARGRSRAGSSSPST